MQNIKDIKELDIQVFNILFNPNQAKKTQKKNTKTYQGEAQRPLNKPNYSDNVPQFEVVFFFQRKFKMGLL